MCEKTRDENDADIHIDVLTDDKPHWVEKLFPPAFQFSLHDLVFRTPTTENGVQEWDNINNTFEKLSRRILPEDIEAIKNVYHRVWLMMRNQKQYPPELIDQVPECQDFNINTTGVEEAKPENEANVSSSAESESASSTCIWDSADIGILRKVYKDTKEENIKLTSHMKVLEVEMTKLKKLTKTKAKELTMRTDELQVAMKANKRLEILSQYLKKELKNSEKVIKNLSEELGEVKEANKGMDVEIANVYKELDREKLEKRKLELEREREVDEIQTEHRQTEQRLVEDSQKMQVRMVEEIRHLREELDKETELHKRSIRGLNHLRMHFGSLPAAEEKDTDPHQLTKWTSY